MKFIRPTVLIITIIAVTLAIVATASVAQDDGRTAGVKAEEKTVLNQRTAYMRAGKGEAAMQFAKEITDHLNDTYPDVSVRVFTEAFGDVEAVHWFADYKDLATLQDVKAKLQKDQKFNQIIASAQGLFIEGRTHVTLMTAIP